MASRPKRRRITRWLALLVPSADLFGIVVWLHLEGHGAVAAALGFALLVVLGLAVTIVTTPTFDSRKPSPPKTSLNDFNPW